MTKRKDHPIGSKHGWRAMNSAASSVAPPVAPSGHFRCGDCKRVLPTSELHNPAYSTCRTCKLMRAQKRKT